MGIEIREYDLPDQFLFQKRASDHRFHIWQPESVSIILGASNEATDSVIAEHVLADEIPVYKRPSGGEAVLITPKTLVISAVAYSIVLKMVRRQFRRFNDTVLNALTDYGIAHIKHSGISDLAIGDLKILGSAVYHSRDRLFYHSVLNISESPAVIAHYLSHPKREPDYRNGRRHSDFVTSLELKGYQIDIRKLQQILESYFLKIC